MVNKKCHLTVMFSLKCKLHVIKSWTQLFQMNKVLLDSCKCIRKCWWARCFYQMVKSCTSQNFEFNCSKCTTQFQDSYWCMIHLFDMCCLCCCHSFGEHQLGDPFGSMHHWYNNLHELKSDFNWVFLSCVYIFIFHFQVINLLIFKKIVFFTLSCSILEILLINVASISFPLFVASTIKFCYKSWFLFDNNLPKCCCVNQKNQKSWNNFHWKIWILFKSCIFLDGFMQLILDTNLSSMLLHTTNDDQLF
jgi:hypothetical protein